MPLLPRSNLITNNKKAVQPQLYSLFYLADYRLENVLDNLCHVVGATHRVVVNHRNSGSD